MTNTDLSDTKVLVTGGAGFIGAHVVRELLDHGAQAVVLDDLSGGFVENIPEKALFVKGSVNDSDLVKKLFTEHKFDYVYHLAAYAAEGLSHFIQKFNYENNLIGSINLMNESVRHDIKCFVFTSSIAVYGENQLPMSEEMVPQPEDPYGISKYAVEMQLSANKKMFDMDYVVFRPHNVYGEYQNIGDTYRNVIGIFMNKIMKKEELPIFGDGKQTRAFSYVGDIVPLIVHSATHRGAHNDVFNVGADKEYSINELADVVMEAMGVPKQLKVYHPARNEVMHAYASHEKVKTTFSHIKLPTTDLKTGIQKMADWAKKVGPQEGSKFGSIEIDKNLPTLWQY